MDEKLIHEDADNSLRIIQTKPGGRQTGEFRVEYGLDVRGGLDWLEAAHRYGECLFHSLEAESQLVE